MNYTILYATKNNTVMSLDRCGNMLKVVAYDKARHDITFSEPFEYREYEKAEKRFLSMCKANGFSEPKFIERAEDEFSVWTD